MSTWREILDLEPEIPVTRTESSFPALHELIARRVGRRQVSFTAAVTDDDRVLVELTRSTSYLGPTEWLDEPSAWRYLPSYVLPDSGGAKRVVTAALTLLQGSGDDLDGKGAGEEVDRKVAALYEAMRSLNLAYIAPPGAPVYVDAAEALPLARAVGQRVRFPNEVAEHQRGTCHDLALLLAASAEHVGIWPWLVLIPGHTFVGYWRDPAAQRDFWDAPRGEAARSYGDPWVITQRRELSRLVSAGAVGVVETIAATRFGGALSFDGACARARGYFTDNPRPLSCAVDVWAARAQVEPLYRAWTEE